MDLCTQRIPHALGIATPCIAERAHRLGPPSNDRRTPRAVIVRYLNYVDRVNILKSYRNSKAPQLDGHKLLIFADYSQEVSKRCKALQPVCNTLFQQGIKFTLAYPATLRFTAPYGESKSFTHPEDAWHYLQSNLRLPMDTSGPPPPPSHRVSAPRDQRSPRKDPAKKLRLTDMSGRYKPA